MCNVIDYCFKNRLEIIKENDDMGLDGTKAFKCIIDGLNRGTLRPEKLSAYGVEYEENKNL